MYDTCVRPYLIFHFPERDPAWWGTAASSTWWVAEAAEAVLRGEESDDDDGDDDDDDDDNDDNDDDVMMPGTAPPRTPGPCWTLRWAAPSRSTLRSSWTGSSEINIANY